MTISLLVSILISLIAGVVAGVIAPFLTAFWTTKNWRKQKSIELKYEAFRGAANALALWAADALNPELQNSKVDYKGRVRQVELRPETSSALDLYSGLVRAFFSEDVAQKFDEATRAPISIEKAPNGEFDKKRLAFIRAAARELGMFGR